MPVAGVLSLGLGEALVRQSSGRHQGQPALSLDVAVGPPGHIGFGVELCTTRGAERSDTLGLTRFDHGAAALALLPLGEGRGRLELGLGPALTLTTTRWSTPSLGVLRVAEAGVRFRGGFGWELGDFLLVQARSGVTVHLGGLDADLAAVVGYRW